MAVATDRQSPKLFLVLAGALVLVSNTFPTRAESGVLRGQALYENHCVACHTCKAHTRRDPAVTNMGELAQEVDRWQANQKLGWKPEERGAVVEYLNRAFYKF
jgi:mono/diheme cytochrome c family protein